MSKTGHEFQGVPEPSSSGLIPFCSLHRQRRMVVLCFCPHGRRACDVYAGHSPTAGTWRVDMSSATVALPFASLGVCSRTPVLFPCCCVAHGSASQRIAAWGLWGQQRWSEGRGYLLKRSAEALCVCPCPSPLVTC